MTGYRQDSADEAEDSSSSPPPRRIIRGTRSARSPSPTRPGSPNFSGRWRLDKSENFDPFLRDCNVGTFKRHAAKIVRSEHHIEQDGDTMNVEVFVTGQPGKIQDYEIGDKFSELEINGMEAEVSTEWDPDGEGIREIHRTDSFEYILVRELEDEDTMVLNLESPKGARAKRIYKKLD